MKKTMILCVAFLVSVLHLQAATELTLQDVTGGKFRTETLSAVTPLADGESYAQISSDGSKIVQYSYKTGQQTGVLFDLNNTQGERIGQLTLGFGADDLGSIMLEENVVRAAGTRYEMSINKMAELIRGAGRMPAQRDTEYRVIRRF